MRRLHVDFGFYGSATENIEVSTSSTSTLDYYWCYIEDRGLLMGRYAIMFELNESRALFIFDVCLLPFFDSSSRSLAHVSLAHGSVDLQGFNTSNLLFC